VRADRCRRSVAYPMRRRSSSARSCSQRARPTIGSHAPAPTTSPRCARSPAIRGEVSVERTTVGCQPPSAAGLHDARRRPLLGDVADRGAGEDVVDRPADQRRFGGFDLEAPLASPPVPEARPPSRRCARRAPLLLLAPDPRRQPFDLGARHADQEPGRQTAVRGLEVHLSARHGDDVDAAPLDQVDEVLEIPRSAIEAVGRPHHDPAHFPAPDCGEELAKPRPGPARARADVVVDELERLAPSLCVDERPAVLELAPDAGAVGAVIADAGVDGNAGERGGRSGHAAIIAALQRR
jgi:hypothetical protein